MSLWMCYPCRGEPRFPLGQSVVTAQFRDQSVSVSTVFMSANPIDADLTRRLAVIRLVLMDVDGTLVHGSRVTIENVVGQLRRLRAHGIRFSIATGRTIFGVSGILQAFRSVHAKLPPMIAYNGGVVAAPGQASVIDRNVID